MKHIKQDFSLKAGLDPLSGLSGVGRRPKIFIFSSENGHVSLSQKSF